MPRRKINFVNGEYYHIYNRGTNKCSIVSESFDILRFLESLAVFNTTERVGSIFEHSFAEKQLGTPSSKLVEIVAFNILDNHYHLILKQLVDGGISKFMQSFGGGYTKYYNERYDRSGVLFQGPFKAEHIDSDEYLNYVSAYVNLNHVVHKLENTSIKWGLRSSLEQYIEDEEKWKNKYFKCKIGVVRNKFKTSREYLKDAENVAKHVVEKRAKDKNLELGVPSDML